ncbi:conserved unknown protein [Ectocarpus siliculosus]|uniref:Lipase-like C-terminal domain-containing protein n=1 Tax=Ectocarpus siliculosus TaxID=2880 RepID=D7G7L0_ECTSI|nr:conserved unknown protein [Ectocarpus siliculosus]|eukprot:CBJ27749.1 conserved unknown protein [Ectocarpus siliculosus]
MKILKGGGLMVLIYMWLLPLLLVKELVTAQTPAPIVPQCNAPIANVVLVHGILGWGPDEVFGLPHIKHGHVLEDSGCFKVHTVALVILGSNHDTCAQLHAQLVGGYADHGLEHSTNISVQHDRYGDKNYTGFIPDFLVPGNMRTYFVAHSLGATTVRQCEIYWRDGSAAEKAATPTDDLSPLYQGGHIDVVSGLVSLNGPIDGTLLVDAFGGQFLELLKRVVFIVEGLIGEDLAEQGIYDLDFDYLGINCSAANVSAVNDCIEEISSLPIYNDPEWGDHAGVSGLEGAQELNLQGDPVSNNTFYSSMSILLWPFSLLIGWYELTDDAFDGWRSNDGLISVQGAEIFAEIVTILLAMDEKHAARLDDARRI